MVCAVSQAELRCPVDTVVIRSDVCASQRKALAVLFSNIVGKNLILTALL